jgi:hypothetical protein
MNEKIGMVVALIVFCCALFIVGVVLMSDTWSSDGVRTSIGVGLAGLGFIGLAAAVWTGVRKSMD